MTGVGHAKPVSHGAARGANSPPLPNFCKDCDRKVRFGDRSRSAGGGGSGSTPTVKQLKESKAADKPKPSRPPDAVAHKEKQAGELPTFGEMKAQEFRLRGKLKWLFEQDRMFWETNSAKSSRRSSFEVDRMPGLNVVPITTTTAKPAVDSPDDAKLVHVVEESFKRVSSSKKTANEMKPPKQAPPTDKAMVSSKGEGLATFTDRHTISSLAKIPWTFTSGTAKFWPRGKSKALPNSSAPPNAEFKARPPVPKPSCVDPMAKRVKASESATLMSREEILSDYDDAPKSGESSEMRSSDDEDEAVSKKVNKIIDRGGAGSLQDVKNQAACLKVKCNMLAKEKDHALRKWKKSCQEIDDAAKMAQALRTAIQTLLEASASDSRADFKARQDILEDQTQALKVRMENLRRKDSEGLQRQSKEKPPSAHLEDRMETLRKSSESRSLGSPEIPRDAEYKVEALRARLEKLMLATNSLVVDEERQPEKGSGEQNTLVEDWLQRQKSEKSELKMKSWLNSLSAELASEESLDTPRAICEKSNGTSGCLTPYTKQRMPSTVKQESPWSSTHDRDAPGSALSSVETKKNVIHKIAEEVQYEAKQWFQVQELLGRVGDDMKSLQEACSTWERRAILAEAQVVHMQQEGHGLKEKTLQLGDVKIAELQKEMLRLRETVDDVKKQVGNINIDPSRWFEAAQNFGYAFMPVNLHVPDGASCGCKSKCDHSSCEKGTPDSRDQWRQRIYATATMTSQPSCSGSTTPTFSIISSSEKTPDSEWRLRSQLPSQQWAKEIAKAEEDEILTTANTTGQVPKLKFPNDPISSASGGKSQERSAKPSHKELGLDSSDSTGEMLLQRQTSTKDTFGVVQQEEQPSRYSNFPTSRRSRSPLRDVLENITSSKENKRPY